MKSTKESEVLVLLVFLATVPACLATDRTTTSTRYVDIATSHESNSDLSNQFRRVRFIKEGEKIKRFMYLLMSEIFLCVIILVQLLHVALIHQPKLTFSENPAEAPQTTFFLLFGGNIFRAKRKKFSNEEEEIWHKSLATGCYFIKNGRISKKSGPHQGMRRKEMADIKFDITYTHHNKFTEVENIALWVKADSLISKTLLCNLHLNSKAKRGRIFKESRESATFESLNDMPRPILRTALEERIIAEAKEEHKEQ